MLWKGGRVLKALSNGQGAVPTAAPAVFLESVQIRRRAWPPLGVFRPDYCAPFGSTAEPLWAHR